MKVLILSNGRGEDQIAASFIQTLKTQFPDWQLSCFPLVGKGAAYQSQGIKPLFEWPDMPSGGFISRLQDLWKDIQQGLVSQTLRQIKALRQILSNYDLILSFGDMTTVFLVGLLRPQMQSRHIHFETAFSVFLRPPLKIEFLFLKKLKAVFTRDFETYKTFTAQNIQAQFEGSLMLDDLALKKDKNLSLPEKYLLLLPSSRKDAIQNLNIFYQIFKNGFEIPMVLAWHPTLELPPSPNLDSLFIIKTEKLGNLLDHCQAAVGMSGTGCEQLAGLGYPVFLIETQYSASNAQRMLYYQKLLGDACQILRGTEENIRSQLLQTLKQPQTLEQMQQAGPLRFGQSGSYLRIIEGLKQEYAYHRR